MADKVALDVQRAPRLIEPGPVVLVTTLFRSQHNVMTAGWLVPLGFDPPRIGVAIHPSRLTHELIGNSEVFGLSVPALDLLDAVHRCGTVSGRDVDKFDVTGLTPVDAVEIDVPLVGECVAHVECGLVQRLSLADHDLFVGEVLAASVLEGLFTDRWLIGDEVELLHHIGGDAYAGLGKVFRARCEDEEES